MGFGGGLCVCGGGLCVLEAVCVFVGRSVCFRGVGFLSALRYNSPTFILITKPTRYTNF